MDPYGQVVRQGPGHCLMGPHCCSGDPHDESQKHHAEQAALRYPTGPLIGDPRPPQSMLTTLSLLT
eukprot:792989-Alexandrium_andersonii.AAC.1